MKEELLLNIEKLHTTTMGIDRIKRNLKIETDDVVSHCRNLILKPLATIERKGKNFYIYADACKITVNAHSLTIITAHKLPN